MHKRNEQMARPALAPTAHRRARPLARSPFFSPSQTHKTPHGPTPRPLPRPGGPGAGRRPGSGRVCGGRAGAGRVLRGPMVREKTRFPEEMPTRPAAPLAAPARSSQRSPRNPPSPSHHSLAGRAAHYGCDPARAVAELEAATRAAPARLEAWEGLAAAHLAAGEPAEAAAVYDGLVSEEREREREKRGTRGTRGRKREGWAPAHERPRALLPKPDPPSSSP